MDKDPNHCRNPLEAKTPYITDQQHHYEDALDDHLKGLAPIILHAPAIRETFSAIPLLPVIDVANVG